MAWGTSYANSTREIYATQWNREAEIPRDGSNVYSLPAGTTATTNTTIESAKYNAFVADVETDLNTPRPIVAGGTGASSASAARTALGIGTIGTQAASSVAITGGAIDGTAIGGSTPAAGAFTTLSSSGAATLASAVVSGNLTFGGTALTDITGADTKLVSGTAGANTDFGLWNADGDLVGGSMTYTRGSLIVGGAAAWNKLAVGTSGQVLTSDGTDAAWASPSSGMTFLSSVDLANDAVADFTLTAGYDAYVFVFANVIPATDGTTLLLRTSTDGGSTFDSGASDYAHQSFFAAGTTVSATRNTADTNIPMTANTIGGAAGETGVSGEAKVFGPSLALKTYISASTVHQNTSGGVEFSLVSGWRASDADVDAIRFLFSSGNLESGTITLWGMKNA